MQGRSPIQLPNDLKSDLEAFRIRLASDTGKIPVIHEVIRTALRVADSHYVECINTLTKIRAGSLWYS